MRMLKTLLFALLATTAFVACEEKADGPVEEAAENVEEAADNMGDDDTVVEEAAEGVEETTDEVEDAVED